MSNIDNAQIQKIQYFVTASYSCSYLADKVASSEVAVHTEYIDDKAYSGLISEGFRRSGLFVYKPHCENCNACISVRIRINDFIKNRSQKRAWAQNEQLLVIKKPLKFSKEHYDLFKRYQIARHSNDYPLKENDTKEQYDQFLMRSNVNTRLIEFREPRPDGGKARLVMVSIIDKLMDGFSSVYTFFEPTSKSGYGIYNILWQIQESSKNGFEYLYLGYWVTGCGKMEYKLHFQPLEYFYQGQWMSQSNYRKQVQ